MRRALLVLLQGILIGVFLFAVWVTLALIGW